MFAKCAAAGCSKPSWNGQPNDYCSTRCRDAPRVPGPVPQPMPTQVSVPRVQGHAAAEQGKMIFIGNPGTGKSTMMNCYAGEVMFKGGMSQDGSGVTFELNTTSSSSGREFMDTPGLSDTRLRTEAGLAIEAAFKHGGAFNIVFAITLESGRVRPDDLTTMKLVLDACSEQINDNDFAILVNKCSKNFLRQYDEQKFTAGIRRDCQAAKMRTTNHIHFAANDGALEDEQNICKPLASSTKVFLDRIPCIMIDGARVVKVQTDQFEQMKLFMEEMKEQMKTMKEQMQAAEKRALEMQAKASEAENRSKCGGKLIFLENLTANEIHFKSKLRDTRVASGSSEHVDWAWAANPWGTPDVTIKWETHGTKYEKLVVEGSCIRVSEDGTCKHGW